MAGINLQGGYGAGGAVDALRVLVAENLRAKTQADQVAQEQARLAEAQARSAEQSRQFGVSTAQTAEQNQLGREQQKAILDLTQKFQHGERLGGQEFQTGERLGGQTFQTGERLGHQTFQTGERTGGQDFTAGQNELGRTFTGGQNNLNRNAAINLQDIQGRQRLQQIVAQGIEDQKQAAAKPVPPPTAEQEKSLTFYQKMVNAIPKMNAAEDKLSDQDLLLINNAPGPQFIKNSALSKAGQSYAQALQAYAEAWLRKTSGAAINAEEWSTFKNNASRQVGDAPETVLQKRQMRAGQADSLATEAGRAYESKYGRTYSGEALKAGMGQVPFTGEQRIIDGKKAEWDGQAWREVIGG